MKGEWDLQPFLTVQCPFCGAICRVYPPQRTKNRLTLRSRVRHAIMQHLRRGLHLDLTDRDRSLIADRIAEGLGL